MNNAMLYEDYIKLRNAKIGEEVTLSDGTKIIRNTMKNRYHHKKPTKNMNLDWCDGTYVE